MELILSDQAYQDMDAAEQANTYSFFRIEIADSAGSTSKNIVVGGYLTQFDLNLNGTGPSDVSVSHRVSERHTPTS